MTGHQGSGVKGGRQAVAQRLQTLDAGAFDPATCTTRGGRTSLTSIGASDAAAYAAGQDVLAFVTADRNVVCALTSARGPHLDLPYETNNFGDPDNQKLATVPVAHCELAVYPAPAASDVGDDCSGTGIGYLGGAALLTPGRARYGECRSGVTQMEAEYGPKGTPNGTISKLPVLPDGGNLERNGLRCSAYRSGVACGNVSGGVGFFISRDHYELISGSGKNVQTAPAKSPKTP